MLAPHNHKLTLLRIIGAFALVLSFMASAQADNLVCYYDAKGIQHDADICQRAYKLWDPKALQLKPRCWPNSGASCYLGNSGECRPGSNKYASYRVMKQTGAGCPADFIVQTTPTKPDNVVRPTCPAGYKLSGAQCVRDTRPTPSCPAGYKFTNGTCALDTTGGNTNHGNTGHQGTNAGNSNHTQNLLGMIVRRGFNLDSMNELDGAAICLVNDSAKIEALNNRFSQLGISHTVHRNNTVGEARDMFDVGICDGFLLEHSQTLSNLNLLGDPSANMVLRETIPCPQCGRNAKSVRPIKPVTPSQPTLAYQLQEQLKRVGCLQGSVDGIWGSGSRRALQEFLSRARLRNINRNQPSQRALDNIAHYGPQFCHLPRKKVKKKAPKTHGVSKKQCLRSCTQLNNKCRRKVARLGDANGWDGDLRRDEWTFSCAPKVSACQTRCGPLGPGECRIDTQGNEYCS